MAAQAGLRVGVVGASGYTGGELCRLLLGHPGVDEIFPTSRELHRFSDVHRNLNGSGLEFVSVEDMRGRAVDVVFVCSPAGEAMGCVPELLNDGARVIDLGPDFRFRNPTEYEETYGRAHTAAALLGDAVYGATEVNRSQIRRATLVANPGCYAIASFLSLYPLIGLSSVALGQPIVIHGINGTTGGPRRPNKFLTHTEATENMLPYSLEGHRHGPEIGAQLRELQPQIGEVYMSTAHGAFTRGIFLQIELSMNDRCTTRTELVDQYRKCYGDGHDREYFILVRSDDSAKGSVEKDYQAYPQVRDVRGSNFMHIGVYTDRTNTRVRIVSVIDNLIKGAGGTGIQNMNLMFGLPRPWG